MNSVYRRSKRRKPIAEINIVPYIDVTLVLLIIFMMTAPMQQTAVEINLPVTRGVKVEDKTLPPVIISIPKSGQYYLSETEQPEKPVSLAELLSHASIVQKNNPQSAFYIKADKAIDYGKVVLVMAALKEAGISHVGLITSPIEP